MYLNRPTIAFVVFEEVDAPREEGLPAVVETCVSEDGEDLFLQTLVDLHLPQYCQINDELPRPNRTFVAFSFRIGDSL